MVTKMGLSIKRPTNFTIELKKLKYRSAYSLWPCRFSPFSCFCLRLQLSPLAHVIAFKTCDAPQDIFFWVECIKFSHISLALDLPNFFIVPPLSYKSMQLKAFQAPFISTIIQFATKIQ